MKYLAVKDFDRHQHYRDRVPPWIKFYNAILDDYAFIQLPDAARSHLMLIWLLASRTKNRIPYDVKYITAAIKARARIDLPALIASGLITVVDEAVGEHASIVASNGAGGVASIALASCEQDASKNGDVEESRRRGDTKEGEENAPPTNASTNDNGEAGRIFAAIRKLVTKRTTPNGPVLSIRQADVDALGARAVAAYEQVGGADRFTDSSERVGFLVRDFEKAYNASPPVPPPAPARPDLELTPAPIPVKNGKGNPAGLANLAELKATDAEKAAEVQRQAVKAAQEQADRARANPVATRAAEEADKAMRKALLAEFDAKIGDGYDAWKCKEPEVEAAHEVHWRKELKMAPAPAKLGPTEAAFLRRTLLYEWRKFPENSRIPEPDQYVSQELAKRAQPRPSHPSPTPMVHANA